MILRKQLPPVLYSSGAVPALESAHLANEPGVQLSAHGVRILVGPRPLASGSGPTPFHAFPLPVVPGDLVDRLAKLVRFAERRVGCCAVALLYLDPTAGRWTASLPAPQSALNDPAVAELAAAMQRADPSLLVGRRPGVGLLMAGGYVATPTADPVAVARQVPEMDGLWLFHLAGSWAHTGAFIRATGRIHPLAILDAVGDMDASGGPHPHDRQWVPSPV